VRQRLLQALGIIVPEQQFLTDDMQHPYNGFIRGLEQVRTAQGEDLESFYLRLLGATVVGRAKTVVAAVRASRVQEGEAPS